MEMMMERESDSAVNQEKLLETMQSDKTALSRAIAQNRELKVQLAELQGGFVKMVLDFIALICWIFSTSVSSCNFFVLDIVIVNRWCF